MAFRLGAWRALVAALAALVVPQSVSAQTPPAANAGVYLLNSVASTQALPPAAYTASAIDGATLVFYWNAVEPQDGVYDWTAIDSQIAAIAAVGKKVNLGVLPGVFTPSWVYAAGAAQFTMIWTAASWGFPLCSVVPLPLPWDAVYPAKWLAFVQQLGSRYAANPAVVMLKIQGVNTATPELYLPYTRPVGTGVGPSGCPQVDYVAAWYAVGYRPARIITSWQTFARAHAKYSPTQHLILETGSWPLVPIRNDGFTSPLYGGDWVSANTIITSGARIAGSRFVVENDSLSAVFAWTRPKSLPTTNQFAYQTTWNVDTDPSCRMNGFVQPCDLATVMTGAAALALAAKVSFVEVYSTDAQDAAEADALATLHAALTASSP